MVVLVAVGDIEFSGTFMGRYEKTRLEKLGPKLANARLVDQIRQHARASNSELILDWLAEADIAFANLETTLAKSKPYFPPRPSYYRFRADPSNAEDLKLLGINVASLGNNHVFGYGDEGFIDTVEALDDAGIKHVGAGMNLEEALSPVIINVEGQRIAFLGFATIFQKAAAPDRFGVAAIRRKTVYEFESKRLPTNYIPFYARLPTIKELPIEEDIHMMQDRIESLRDKADFVVVSIHWGPQGLGQTPTYCQTVLGHAMVDAGADLVFGHHPHTAQSIEIYKDKHIFYSTGNFFMQIEVDVIRFALSMSIAFMLKVNIEKGRASRVEILPIITDETGLPILTEDYEYTIKRLKEICAPLNTSVVSHNQGALIRSIV